MTYPVDPRFIPSMDDLRDLWLTRNNQNSGNYASVPEKIEFEMGWEIFAATLGDIPRALEEAADAYEAEGIAIGLEPPSAPSVYLRNRAHSIRIGTL